MSRQSRHSARARGRARRRLRHLRRLRELQLRDAGGLVFDLYRFGERREALVRGKFDAIIATDKEIRALEEFLGESRGERRLEVRAPGIGGTCPSCGELHAADANYCATCGMLVAIPPAQPAPPEGVYEEPYAAAPEEVTFVEPVAEAVPEEAVPDLEEEVVAEAEPAAEPETPAVEPEMAAEPDTPAAEPEPAAEDGEDPAPSKDDSGEVAAVGPRRARAGQARPRRRRGSSR